MRNQRRLALAVAKFTPVTRHITAHGQTSKKLLLVPVLRVQSRQRQRTVPLLTCNVLSYRSEPLALAYGPLTHRGPLGWGSDRQRTTLMPELLLASFKGTDVTTRPLRTGYIALIDRGTEGTICTIDGLTAGQQGMGWRGATIELQ